MTDATAPTLSERPGYINLAIVGDRVNTLTVAIDKLGITVSSIDARMREQDVARARQETATEAHLASADQRLDGFAAMFRAFSDRAVNYVTQAQHTETLRVIADQAAELRAGLKAQADALTATQNNNLAMQADLRAMRGAMLWGAGVLTLVVASTAYGFISGHISILAHP